MNVSAKKTVEDDHEGPVAATEQEDEFVSDSHQVSSRDLAEADEAMKRLGLDKVNTLLLSEYGVWNSQLFSTKNIFPTLLTSTVGT